MATPNSWRSRKNDKEDASGSWRSRRSDKDDASGSWRSRRNDKDDSNGSWRNRRNDRDETNGTWRNRRNDKDETNGNLQYGVNAQHIDPSWESQVKKKLEQFAQSDDPQLIFPPMERHERKRLHDLARRWGLISSSSGREPNRTCIVSRRRPANLLASVAANETQPISLDMDMMSIIAQFIRDNPIESTDIEKHLATLRVRGRTSRDTIFRDRVDKLIPPAHNCTDEMMRQRSQLPAFRQKEEVLSAIENHKVVLITGGTGCGKTTQVPQFLLEDAERRQIPLRIICTQPRRLPAISVADRVAKERGEKLGTTVGYHIRLEQKTSPQTVLTYCTSGVLLRMLTQDDTAKDVSHIILDEIHEREQNTDYLLIALKQALKKRDDLKVILMSATMEGNLKMFKQYFGDKVLVKHIDIPSRLFNVEKFFLGDVIAMTGFVPAESMFGGMFVTPGFSSFPAVDSWPSRGKNEWTGVDYYGKKNEWDTNNSKLDWETEPSNMHGMTEVQTAPNLASLVPTTSSNPPHLITSSSVSSLQPMQQNHQMHVENLLNVAQQLVNSQQSVSTAQMTQQYQQSPPAGSVHQNSPQYHQGSSMYQQAGYQPSYVQQLPLFQTASCTQGNIVHSQQSNYVQAPTAVPLLHSATWGGGMDQSGYVHQPDVVDLPCDNLDPETLEQFRQIGGFSNHDEIQHHHAGSFSNDWQDISTVQQPNWQHTQSYPVITQSTQYQTPVLQSWDSHQIYSSQGGQYPSSQPPIFYVPESFETTPTNKQMTYFGQPMDGTVGYAVRPTQTPQSHVPQQLMHQIQTMVLHQQTRDKILANNDCNDFASSMRREQQDAENMRQQLANALPERPTSFEPRLKLLLNKRRTEQSNLVNMYLRCGGQQWSEGVDLDLALAVIKYCMDSPVDGAILVFLPGFDDIVQLKDKVKNQIWRGRKAAIYTLHSQMNSIDQQRVFEPTRGMERKVILSTNIAEASLTIDDVVFVIDSGKVKEKTYDHTSRISQLKITWIAKSNAEQRSGRAGRCREGFCFRLYSVEDHECMLETQTAEMQRAAIHDVCLHAKVYAPENMSVKQFLQLAPEPPAHEAVENSMSFLEQLGALYSEASTSDTNYFDKSRPPNIEPELTDLGRLVAQLPLDPQLARLLLFGLALKCLSPVVTLVASLSHRDPFIIAMSEEREQSNRQRDYFARRDFSDHITLLRVFNEFSEKPHKELMNFCRLNYLSFPAMRMIQGIRRQLLVELCRVRMITYDGDPLSALRDPAYNQYSGSWPMIQAAIVAGCYPGIGFVKAGNKLKKIRTSTELAATLHPSSIIKRQVLAASKRSDVINQYTPRDAEDPTIEYLAFQELAKIDEGITLRTVTVVPPCAIVLFAGAIRLKQSTIFDFQIVGDEDLPEEETDEERDKFPTEYILELESWIAVRGRFGDMQRLLQLRFKFMSYFLETMSNPQILSKPKLHHVQLLETLSQVLTLDHQRMGFNPCNLPTSINRPYNLSGISSFYTNTSQQQTDGYYNLPQTRLQIPQQQEYESQEQLSKKELDQSQQEVNMKLDAITLSRDENEGRTTTATIACAMESAMSNSVCEFSSDGLETTQNHQRQSKEQSESRDCKVLQETQDAWDGSSLNENRNLKDSDGKCRDEERYQDTSRYNKGEWPKRNSGDSKYSRVRDSKSREDGWRGDSRTERLQREYSDEKNQRNWRDDGAGPSYRGRYQNYYSSGRDYQQSRERNRWDRNHVDKEGGNRSQLTWQQREMEAQDRDNRWRDRGARREFHGSRYGQRTEYDHDEPVPEDPRVDYDEDWNDAQIVSKFDTQNSTYRTFDMGQNSSRTRKNHYLGGRGGFTRAREFEFSNRQYDERNSGYRDSHRDKCREDRDSEEFSSSHLIGKGECNRNYDRSSHYKPECKNYDNNRSGNSFEGDRSSEKKYDRVYHNSNNQHDRWKRRGSTTSKWN